MIEVFKKHPGAIVAALLFHVLIGLLFVVGFNWTEKPELSGNPVAVKIIDLTKMQVASPDLSKKIEKHEADLEKIQQRRLEILEKQQAISNMLISEPKTVSVPVIDSVSVPDSVPIPVGKLLNDKIKAKELAKKKATESQETVARKEVEAESKANTVVKAKQEAKRTAKAKARKEAKRKAKKEARRVARAQAKKEEKRKAKKEAKRLAKAKATKDANRKARKEAKRKAKKLAKAKAEAKKEAQKEEKQKIAKARAKEESKKKAKEEVLKEANRKVKEAKEKAEKVAAAKAKRDAEKRAEKAAKAAKVAKAQKAAKAAANKKAQQAKAQQQAKAKKKALGNWKKKVGRHVRPRWHTPPGSGGMKATVRVKISRSGYIRSLSVISCKGSAGFCSSIKTAFKRAEPLPSPTSNDLYKESLVIGFRR